MPTITARLQLGKAHPSRGGILDGYHTLELFEGSKLFWVAKTKAGRIKWLPRHPSTIASDGLLLATAMFMPNSRAGLTISRQLGLLERSRSTVVDLSDYKGVDFSAVYAQTIHSLEHNNETEYRLNKLTMMVSEVSTLNSQLDTFASLECDVEIMTTTFSKAYSGLDERYELWQRNVNASQLG